MTEKTHINVVDTTSNVPGNRFPSNLERVDSDDAMFGNFPTQAVAQYEKLLEQEA